MDNEYFIYIYKKKKINHLYCVNKLINPPPIITNGIGIPLYRHKQLRIPMPIGTTKA